MRTQIKHVQGRPEAIRKIGNCLRRQNLKAVIPSELESKKNEL